MGLIGLMGLMSLMGLMGLMGFMGSYHTIETYRHKRNAEQLSHVERHALLEGHLLLLEELNEEAEGEDPGKAESEVPAGANFSGERRVWSGEFRV